MSFNMVQLIVTGITGLASATSVAYFTIQSDSSQFTTNSLQTQKLDSNLISVVPKHQLKSSYSTSNSSDLVSHSSSPVVITPPTSGCKIRMAIVDDPEPPLNVRSSPEVREGNKVAQLNNNTFVSVADEKSGWLRITEPVIGWVAKNRTRSSCATVDKTITFSPESDTAIVRGEMIGTGSHNYRVRMIQGQTMTIKNSGDVFPAIISPDGQLMAREPNIEGNKNEWTDTMPISGVYTLEFDSNFRGFEYEFLVEIKEGNRE
ncbi:MAG: SH3 domain-containing protein [Okeania sp. SIO2D1]|uniref:SH3 domain-containing protein n=1 Tax=Okeania sp. SIO2C9 TaxID=2607791 RepID=UPI0013BE38BE|nr:SH3 domain-containing protein [Okeania sp. SIO2C9]NEQ77500.1 SH3 domain-containing protein [Okeania sp. SIO2C9]NES71778.1 SH3 domain-containing protein [Okeania sp. SIO2D1]